MQKVNFGPIAWIHSRCVVELLTLSVSLGRQHLVAANPHLGSHKSVVVAGLVLICAS